MKSKALPARAFRPTPENEERLEYAKQIGLNITQIINEALDAKLPEVLREKSEKLRKALNAPVP